MPIDPRLGYDPNTNYSQAPTGNPNSQAYQSWLREKAAYDRSRKAPTTRTTNVGASTTAPLATPATGNTIASGTTTVTKPTEAGLNLINTTLTNQGAPPIERPAQVAPPAPGPVQSTAPAPAPVAKTTAMNPTNFDYSNRYASDITAKNGQGVANPYMDRIMAGKGVSANQLNPMAKQWEEQGTPLFNSLMAQTQAGLEGGIGQTQLGQEMRNTAADQSAKATAAQMQQAREAGLSGTELMNVRGQGSLAQQDALRSADMASEGIMAGRRGEALSALGFARSPAEQLGQAQIGAEQNWLGRLMSEGGRVADQTFTGGQNLANRMLTMGEGQSGRQLSGLGLGMEFGPETFKGYGSAALGGGAGLNMQDPGFQVALQQEMANGLTQQQAITKLINSYGK